MSVKKKKVSIIVIVSILSTLGGIFLLYGSWLMVDSKISQDKAHEIAKSKVVSSSAQVITKKATPKSYQFEKGEIFGVLHIPSIKAELPIIEGTGEEELKQGVGHFIGSSYPMQNNQIVLSGHRNTVFQNLGDLVIGDYIVVEMLDGEYKYEIKYTEIVDADDRTVIRSTAPNEILTLTTCYPFSYIGNAPKRYIVYAEPVFVEQSGERG
ncbi:class D sortase [Virgibacillus litoralis]|uniref:Sortase A n=1 Tax=Virgibacillus litoralis TaxID=578221 RepID=A0ABS4H883_9BACI|nr:class D sortase [Virgibacillus litoralis]MBP1947108.1 sortase A [Virgibacillus litoralis]